MEQELPRSLQSNSLPPSPPYKHYVAGAGVVEAASEDIKVGTPFNEIVTDVFVSVGQTLKKNTPLFQLNIETLSAEYEEAKQKRDVAKTKYEDQKTELSLYQSLKDKRAVSENELNKRYYSTEVALNELKEAEASMEVIASKIQRLNNSRPHEWAGPPSQHSCGGICRCQSF